MAARAARLSKTATALALLGIVAVLVSVWGVYALVRPSSPEPEQALRAVAGLGRPPTEEDPPRGINDPSEDNEPLLESVVPSSTVTSLSAEASVGVEATGTSTAVQREAGRGFARTGGWTAIGTADDPVDPAGDRRWSDEPEGGTSSYRSGRVFGTVRHEVWGAGLGNVHVSMSPGAGTSTSSSGGYVLDASPQLIGTSAVYVLDVSGAGLLSHDSLSRAVLLQAGSALQADFELFYAFESSGVDWRDAEWWEGWRSRYSASAMNGLLAKVSSATSEFSGVDSGNIDNVLSPRRGASSRAKARAEQLALWLDLASARVGFDAPTREWSVRGWGSGGASTAITFVRQMDAIFSSGADVNWIDVRRLCSGDALAD